MSVSNHAESQSIIQERRPNSGAMVFGSEPPMHFPFQGIGNFPTSVSQTSPSSTASQVTSLPPLYYSNGQVFDPTFRNGYGVYGSQNAYFPSTLPMLTAPVQWTPFTSEDEATLVDALRKSTSNASTYKVAIEALSGHNNHTRQDWVDYYLTHTTRINDMVSRAMPEDSVAAEKPTPPRTVKKPTFSKYNSKSPSPPSQSDRQHTTEHNSFTEADNKYFMKAIKHEYKKDPMPTQKSICAKLADNVSCHSANAWRLYWKKNSSTVKAIRTGSFHSGKPLLINTGDLDDDAESSSSDDSDTSVESEDEPDVEPDRPDYAKAPAESNGQAYTEADIHMLARYMAGLPKNVPRIPWKEINRLHPAHTSRAWGSYYRRNLEEISMLAELYR